MKKTIESLNLDRNENLRTIRRIWGNIYDQYSLQDIKEAANDADLRKKILQDTDLDVNRAKRFRNPLYWNLVVEYEWFFFYFKNNLLL